MDLDAATICWDDDDNPVGNAAHIAPTGLTKAEVEAVIRNPFLPVQRSRSSSLPCKVGPAADGRLIFVSWKVESVNPPAVSPATAYYLSRP